MAQVARSRGPGEVGRARHRQLRDASGARSFGTPGVLQ